MSKNNTKKQNKKRKKRSFIIKICLLVMLLLAVAAALIFYLKFGDEIAQARISAKELVEASTLDTFRASETSIVYDAAGKQIATLTGDKKMYYMTIDKIPKAAVKAMIATEDRAFYEHHGVSLKATAAAAWSLIRNRGEKKRGGSTITQQLARNIFLNNAKEFSRKIKEIFIARELEKKYSKDQIMEFYLNNIYFANGYYGIEAASKGYFNKSCTELSLSQLTFICSIPNSPTRYDPIENYNNTLERRNRILEQMYNEKQILKEEYDAALSEEIVLDVPKTKIRNYIETYVLNCSIRALMKEAGFEFEYDINAANNEEYKEAYGDMYSQCQQMLYRNGYRIYTSIDTKKQKMLQSAINEKLSDNKKKSEDGVYDFQGAGVCIDNENGKVVAVVGGRSQSSITGYTFNRAFQSFRQPGSAIKPVAVYGPAFDNGYGPDSIIKDEPIKDGPKNSNGRYLGNISLRTAIEQSTNTIAWKMFQEITPKKCLNYLTDMHFTKIVDTDLTLASALGGLTNGVSPVELASAYAALENKGVYREPTCIFVITDSEGKEILRDDTFEEERIYSEETAVNITDTLEGVLTRGTAKGHALSDMSCAGKTGTTNDHKDGWFAGYTPYYTTVVWVGCDTPKSVDDLLGNTYPLYIWESFMNTLHEGLLYKEFDRGDFDEPSVTDAPEPVKTKKPQETFDPEDYTDEPDDNPANEPDGPSYVEPDISEPGNPGVSQPTSPPVTNPPATEPPSVTEAPIVTQAPEANEPDEPEPYSE